MCDGQIVCEGPPNEVVTESVLSDLYGVSCDVYTNRSTAHPFYMPRSGAPVARTESATGKSGFAAQRVSVGFGDTMVVRDLSLSLPGGSITAIVGPNASGKSTLLRGCARLLRPSTGVISLDGHDVRKGSHKSLARRLSLLLQGAVAPPGFLVEDLVATGRIPHQSLLRRWSNDDEIAVEDALERCQLCELRERPLETLSGGPQRRCWFGMALAQDTPVLLLDEPTTFLDPAAQFALLDTVYLLNRELGRTVVMVLHDLNLAARYADHLVVIQDGTMVTSGSPQAVITQAMLRDVFAVEAEIFLDPRTGRPLGIPRKLSGSQPLPNSSACLGSPLTPA